MIEVLVFIAVILALVVELCVIAQEERYLKWKTNLFTKLQQALSFIQMD